jgi:hypothetical protein
MIHEQLFNTLFTGYSLMFESILRHKQLVIAAIAITALAGYVVPLNQFAAATILNDDGTTNLEDNIFQDGEASASGSQSSTITAPNRQTNAIVTGDATASQTNTATSTANAGSAAFGGSAIGGDGGDDGCGDCDKKGDKNGHDWKNDDHKCDECNGGGGDGGFAIGGDADSRATATSSATVSGNTNVADTSADNNEQSNENEQEFEVEQEQDVEAEVENDATQINDNYFNVDLDLFDD